LKILVVADEEDSQLWDFYKPGMLDDIDLILSAGDLDPKYLSFLVTMAHCPLLYIHGNHDAKYERFPPDGCDCIDDKLVSVKGIRIMGLGGCALYNNGPFQFTERQMKRRIRRLSWRVRRSGGVDIILTHAPAAGYGDLDNLTHRGFEVFLPMLDKFRPQYMVHGHVHLRYSSSVQRLHTYQDTIIINASGKYILEL